MPREITHWHILSEAVSRISSAGEFEGLRRHLSLAYLGAMTHDAPYYLNWGRDPLGNQLAERFHGSHGEDTLITWRKLASQIHSHPQTDEREALAAFWIGVISHWVVDTTFHPLIFYFTGDYYHPEESQRLQARSRHRLFEVYLDAHFSKLRRSDYPKLFTELFPSCDNFKPLISRQLRSAIAESQQLALPQEFWDHCFADISRIQKLCFSSTAGVLFRLLSFFSPRQIGSLDSLSSFLRHEDSAIFRAKLSFQNPVTGEQCQATIDDLTEAAISALMLWITESWEFLTDPTAELRGPLQSAVGISLNYGTFHSVPEAATHYSKEGLKIAGLALQ